MKIVMCIAFWGVLCCAPFFVHGDENTNAPVAIVPKPTSVPATNQPAQVPPADDSIDSLRKKAEAGDAKSQYNLGVCYANGEGVEKDVTEAAKWFRKAADQGFAQAQFQLSAYYYTGTGVQKDIVEAVQWTRKAADQGFVQAQLVVGMCYRDGTGVQKDLVEASKWFRMAADQGDATAQFNLGVFYANGTGIRKDVSEAAMWYHKAADQGLVQAQRLLAACYYNGIGVEKDPVEAAKWCRKAAEQGDAMAQGAIGASYVEGVGVIKNEVEGLAWLYVSSANGNQRAVNTISKYERTYSGAIIEAARQRATELQAQIASHQGSADNDSATAILQPAKMPKESGSGAFISSDGLVLTAAHVVQGALRIEVVTATGTFAATVVKIDANNDVALLKCTGSNFTPLPIATSKEARAGATVFTVGFPNIQIQGFDPKLTSGEISSQTGFQDDPRQWQISVPIQPGNSGGPLCDENGNLIGIVESTLNPLTMAKIEGEIPQNVNYAVKSSYILPLLDDVQNLPQPRVAKSGEKFEDVVDSVRLSTVLILVY